MMMLRYLAALHADEQQNNLAIAQVLVDRQRRQKRRPKRYQTREWLLRRPLHGQYDQLMVELREEDVGAFRNFIRMEPRMFQELLDRVGPRLLKKDSFWRKALVPGLKLAITLRHLATGDSYQSLMYAFRVASNTISSFVPEVCEAILAEYQEEVISTPSTPEGWKEIAEVFGRRWNFQHALGALDGKHIRIRCPAKAGSLYYNYKGYHSMVLMALVDADYKFLWLSCGANGSASDAQLWNQCELKTAIEQNDIGFPQAEPLPRDDRNMPYFLIGDDAFALKSWMMKPFSRRNMADDERIFNYRLSRARRIVENAFGILANRFGCLLTSLRQKPETVVSMVMSCCCLHNLMRLRYPTLQNAVVDDENVAHQVIPGAWRDDAHLDDMDIQRGGNFTTREAKKQRLYLKHYYNSPVGAVPWQNQMI